MDLQQSPDVVDLLRPVALQLDFHPTQTCLQLSLDTMQLDDTAEALSKKVACFNSCCA